MRCGVIVVMCLVVGETLGGEKGYLTNLVAKTESALINAVAAVSAPVYRMIEEGGKARKGSRILSAVTRGLPHGLADAVYSITRAPLQIIEGVLGKPSSSADLPYWRRKWYYRR